MFSGNYVHTICQFTTWTINATL